MATNFRVGDVSETEVTLEWDAPSQGNVDQYFIDFKEEQDKNYSPVGRIDGKKTKFSCGFLEKDKSYNFRIKPRNAAGYSHEAAVLQKPVKLAPVTGAHCLICH